MSLIDELEEITISDPIAADKSIFTTSLFRSDKCDPHLYTRMYYELFKDIHKEKLRFLEIGVLRGESLSGWVKIFSDSLVVGVDNNSLHEAFHKRLLADKFQMFGVTPEEQKRMRIHYYDSVDYMSVRRVFQGHNPRWHIIIDDGDHNPYAQWATFTNHIELLEPGGTYVIEDVNHIQYGVHADFLISNISEYCKMHNLKLRYYYSQKYINKGTIALVIT